VAPHRVPRDAPQPLRVTLQPVQLLAVDVEDGGGAVGAAGEEVGGGGGLVGCDGRGVLGGGRGLVGQRGRRTGFDLEWMRRLQQQQQHRVKQAHPLLSPKPNNQLQALTCPIVACGCHAIPVALSGCALNPVTFDTLALSAAVHRLTAPPQPQAASSLPSGLNAQPPTGRSSAISEDCCA